MSNFSPGATWVQSKFFDKNIFMYFFYDLNRFEDFLFNFEHFCPFLVRGDMGPGWIFWQKYVFALFKFLSFEHFWPLNQGPTQVRDQFCNKNIFSYFLMLQTELKHFWPEVRGRCGSWVNFSTKIFFTYFFIILTDLNKFLTFQLFWPFLDRGREDNYSTKIFFLIFW